MLFTRRSIGICLALSLAISLVVDLTPVDATSGPGKVKKTPSTKPPKKALSSSSGSAEEPVLSKTQSMTGKSPKKAKKPKDKGKGKDTSSLHGPGAARVQTGAATAGDTSGLGIPTPVDTTTVKDAPAGQLRLTSLTGEVYDITAKEVSCFGALKPMLGDLLGKAEKTKQGFRDAKATMTGHGMDVQTSGEVFAKALAFCRKYPKIAKDQRTDEQKASKKALKEAGKLAPRFTVAMDKEWNDKFMRSFNTPKLFEFLNGVNYLDMPALLDLAIGSLADLIKGKSTKEMREIFGITDGPDGFYGFGPNGEADIRKENDWITNPVAEKTAAK